MDPASSNRTSPSIARPTRRRRRWLTRILILASVGLFLNLSGCMERMFYLPEAGPTPIPADLPNAEWVSFRSADGTALTGWFIPGVTTDPQQLAPTVLHVHGNAGNITSHAWFTAHLPPAGINVFIFDFRGYGGSEGSATRRAPLIADTHAALDALLDRPDVDPARIGIYGQSLGGAIGLVVMADRPELAAGVFESAFASWRDVAASAVGGSEPNVIARGLAALLIHDGSRPEDAIARIERPLLLLHGTDDSIVPYRHGERLAAASSHATLHTLDGGEHNSLRSSYPEVDTLMIEFFGNHLHGSDSP